MVSAEQPNAWTAGFDCTKNLSGQERLICSSRELSALDVQLATAYKTALGRAADKKLLRTLQSTWRTTERDACSDAPCLAAASEFNGKVEEVYVQEGEDRTALSEHVRQLVGLNQALSQDVKNLTLALKGSAKTQANWGELVLERVLEASGLASADGSGKGGCPYGKYALSDGVSLARQTDCD